RSPNVASVSRPRSTASQYGPPPEQPPRAPRPRTTVSSRVDRRTPTGYLRATRRSGHALRGVYHPGPFRAHVRCEHNEPCDAEEVTRPGGGRRRTVGPRRRGLRPLA